MPVTFYSFGFLLFLIFNNNIVFKSKFVKGLFVSCLVLLIISFFFGLITLKHISFNVIMLFVLLIIFASILGFCCVDFSKSLINYFLSLSIYSIVISFAPEFQVIYCDNLLFAISIIFVFLFDKDYYSYLIYLFLLYVSTVAIFLFKELGRNLYFVPIDLSGIFNIIIASLVVFVMFNYLKYQFTVGGKYVKKNLFDFVDCDFYFFKF